MVDTAAIASSSLSPCPSITLPPTTAPPNKRGGRTRHDDGKQYLLQGLYASDRVETASVVDPLPLSSKRAKRSSTSIATHRSELSRGILSEVPLNELDGEDHARGNAGERWSDKWDGTTRVLPLPILYGMDELLDEDDERDFKLPFDILRDFWFSQDVVPSHSDSEDEESDQEENVAGTKTIKMKPAKYRRINRNLFVGRKPDKSATAAICECSLPSEETALGCLDDCMNRMMLYSCSPGTCPCGERCSNLPLYMQKGIPAGKEGLVTFWTGDRGFGLKTLVDIPKGTFVVEYCGEIIPISESYTRTTTLYASSTSFYFLRYDSLDVIDAGTKGNLARFINHSCGSGANCLVINLKFSALEEFQMGIFSSRDIKAGEELSYDYGWQDFSTIDGARGNEEESVRMRDLGRQKCFCGSEACSGFLGKKKEEKVEKKILSKGKGRGVRGLVGRLVNAVGKGKGRKQPSKYAEVSSDEEEEEKMTVKPKKTVATILKSAQSALSTLSAKGSKTSTSKGTTGSKRMRKVLGKFSDGKGKTELLGKSSRKAPRERT